MGAFPVATFSRLPRGSSNPNEPYGALPCCLARDEFPYCKRRRGQFCLRCWHAWYISIGTFPWLSKSSLEPARSRPQDPLRSTDTGDKLDRTGLVGLSTRRSSSSTRTLVDHHALSETSTWIVVDGEESQDGKERDESDWDAQDFSEQDWNGWEDEVGSSHELNPWNEEEVISPREVLETSVVKLIDSPMDRPEPQYMAEIWFHLFGKRQSNLQSIFLEKRLYGIPTLSCGKGMRLWRQRPHPEALNSRFWPTILRCLREFWKSWATAVQGAPISDIKAGLGMEDLD
ncbi:hypothetical protein BJ170DRAFT_413515 [Xylariales sp. AK1849]|nr:hypothetical protein BJ170DRAFT_413515 [Xylariales sp. AK1849]